MVYSLILPSQSANRTGGARMILISILMNMVSVQTINDGLEQAGMIVMHQRMRGTELADAEGRPCRS
jgi:hypothetical protein